MTLQELFDHLTYGELGQFFIGGLEDGGISNISQPNLINNINLGLLELYTEFPLKTKEVFIQLYEHITTYTLHTDYAQSNLNSTQPTKYIVDYSADPFINDVLLIDSVFNEDGAEYPLNDSTQTFSVFTPSYNSIQVPFVDGDNAISVIYRASPQRIPTTNVNPSLVDVPIPPQLVGALISFVVSKVHSSIGSSNETNKAGLFYNKFKAEIANIKLLGLIQKEQIFNERLWSNGWV